MSESRDFPSENYSKLTKDIQEMLFYFLFFEKKKKKKKKKRKMPANFIRLRLDF